MCFVRGVLRLCDVSLFPRRLSCGCGFGSVLRSLWWEMSTIPKGCTEFETATGRAIYIFPHVRPNWVCLSVDKMIIMLNHDDLSNLIQALETAKDCEK